VLLAVEIPPLPGVPDLVEIGILWLALYAALRFFRRTMAGGIFRGVGLLVWPVLLGVFLTLRALHLEVVGEIARGAVPIFLVGLIVVFQAELRHGIARLGQSGLFRKLFRRRTKRVDGIRAVDEIVQAVFEFKQRRVGALIVIERAIDLSAHIDTGVKLDSLIRKELLTSIFAREAVLHDGAVIVRGDRVAAASCFLPLTERSLDLAYGTRHRAAVGISEQSDAVVIVTSEERGQVAVAEGGTLTSFQEPRWLTAHLSVVFAERHGLARTEAAPA
jgi:diadenylate cyclase